MTTLDTQPPADLPAMKSRLTARLARLSRRVRGHIAAEGFAHIAAIAVGLASVSFLADWQLELSLPLRLAFGAACAIAIAVLAWRIVVTPLRSDLSPIRLADALDRVHGVNGRPRLAPRVAAVLQLPDLLDHRYGCSPTMVHAAAARSYADLDRIDFTSHTDRNHLTRSLVILSMALAMPLFFGLASPDLASLWARRWFMLSNQPWPRFTTLQVVGVTGDKLTIPSREPFVLRVNVTDKKTPTEEVWLRLDDPDTEAQTLALVRFAQGDFRYDLSPLQRPVKAWVWGGDATVGPFTIQPVDRPRIIALSLTSKRPGSGETERHDFSADAGEVSLLPMSEAELTIITSAAVASAVVTTDAPAPRGLTPVNDHTFIARWVHGQPVKLRIELVAAEGGIRSHPVPITIGMKEDRPPRITLRHRGVRQTITPVATIPLTASAQDDYALTSIHLLASPQRSAESKETGEPPPPLALYGPADPATETSLETKHDFEVEPLKLIPGDLLHLSAEVADNNYQGSQTAQSVRTTFRIVSPQELFREILLRQQGLRAAFRKATTSAEEMRTTMAGATLPDQAPDLLRPFRLTQRETWRISQELSASAEEMRLNKLGGPEAYELIRRTVLQPLRALHDDTMTAQRQALEQMKAADEQTIIDLIARQEQVVTEMNQILNAMAQWDSFIDVVNQLNEVIQIQERVRTGTQQLKDKNTESIFDE